MELDSICERLSAADAALVDALAARQRLVFEVAQVKASGTAALRKRLDSGSARIS